MKTTTVNILGTEYMVNVGSRKELKLPKNLAGQCAYYLPSISVEHSMRDCNTKKESDARAVGTVAHEVFHGYVHESGIALSEDMEEALAIWYESMWRKMNNTICSILDSMGILDSQK